jgi:hypothetical protein
MGQMLQFEAVCRKPPSVGSFPAHGPVRQGRRTTQPPSPRAAPRRRTSQRRTGTSPCAARLARWGSSPRLGSAYHGHRGGGGGLADSSPQLPETPTGPLFPPPRRLAPRNSGRMAGLPASAPTLAAGTNRPAASPFFPQPYPHSL